MDLRSYFPPRDPAFGQVLPNVSTAAGITFFPRVKRSATVAELRSLSGGEPEVAVTSRPSRHLPLSHVSEIVDEDCVDDVAPLQRHKVPRKMEALDVGSSQATALMDASTCLSGEELDDGRDDNMWLSADNESHSPMLSNTSVDAHIGLACQPPSLDWEWLPTWSDAASRLAEYLLPEDIARLQQVSRAWRDSASLLASSMHKLSVDHILCIADLPHPSAMRCVERLDLRRYTQSLGTPSRTFSSSSNSRGDGTVADEVRSSRPLTTNTLANKPSVPSVSPTKLLWAQTTPARASVSLADSFTKPQVAAPLPVEPSHCNSSAASGPGGWYAPAGDVERSTWLKRFLESKSACARLRSLQLGPMLPHSVMIDLLARCQRLTAVSLRDIPTLSNEVSTACVRAVDGACMFALCVIVMVFMRQCTSHAILSRLYTLTQCMGVGYDIKAVS